MTNQDSVLMGVATKYALATGKLRSSLEYAVSALESSVKYDEYNVFAKSALKMAKETLEEVEENLK